MNCIVWNNIDSRSIPGLLICELPSISRPKIRTQITEIEGKDGDISDNLGYSAYDKTLKIALVKNYDINAIAKYLSGSGKITFSNEPDKFYNAQISEQIDFERLIRFKTATVKFHTQPFKYLINESLAELEITHETEFSVINQGLEKSKPIITLTGSVIVEIVINGYAQFQVDIDDEYLTIDSEKEECYKDNLQTLKNRNMTGIFPVLQPGENVITWSGNLTKIEVQPKSRWL
ncbi:MAG: phage tail family protein [Oscillospiraceae bacterium]|nr:phage tail family protein [Oscillospiraceae bacterium]